MLIRRSLGDKNFNIFEINELCISTGITCDEPCEVVLEVNEETKEYPCTLDMDQSQQIVLELKNAMTWSRRDRLERTLAYLDSGVANILGKKFVMTHEGTIVSQEDDQCLEEITIVDLVNEEKGKIFKFRNYDEELEMLEDWLINPRVDKHDCLMFDDNIGKEKTVDKITELFYNLVDSSRESRRHQ